MSLTSFHLFSPSSITSVVVLSLAWVMAPAVQAQDNALSLAIKAAFPGVVTGEQLLLLSPVVQGSHVHKDCLRFLEEDEPQQDEDIASALRAYCEKSGDVPVSEAGLQMTYLVPTEEEVRAAMQFGKDLKDTWPTADGLTSLGQAGLSQNGLTLVFRYAQTWGPMSCYGQFHIYKRATLEAPFQKETGEPLTYPYPYWWMVIC